MANQGGAECFLVLDLGGTWIKGAASGVEGLDQSASGLDLVQIRNPAATSCSLEGFVEPLRGFCLQLAKGAAIRGVVASTAGAVDGEGKGYRVAGEHLGIMATSPWRERMEEELGCEFWLINDADAFLLGLAVEGSLARSGAVGGLVIGTGLGFSMVRDGRWWKPAREMIYLGSARTPAGTYDQLASATALADKAGGDLLRFLTEPEFSAQRDAYWNGLRQILATATILFQLDEIVLGGGLVDACQAAQIDLPERLGEDQAALLPPGLVPAQIRVASQANRLTLSGALALAQGNYLAAQVRFEGGFENLDTEQTVPSAAIETFAASEIVTKLMEAEVRAAEALQAETEKIAALANRMAESLRQGGRVIYVGAGTSGRLAALDAVEIPCTFGEDPSRFVSVIAGGLADAALTIESQFEEDHSAVPDMILLQLRPEDMVLGISASGTAFFVRSALRYSQSCGAHTVLVHEAGIHGSAFFDADLHLHSGEEVVPGSTRLKAGTATKKVLNMLSTTAQILRGRVRNGRMIDLQCTNEKLRHRAEGILSELGGMGREEARERLVRHGFRLRDALQEIGRA